MVALHSNRSLPLLLAKKVHHIVLMEIQLLDQMVQLCLLMEIQTTTAMIVLVRPMETHIIVINKF